MRTNSIYLIALAGELCECDAFSTFDDAQEYLEECYYEEDDAEVVRFIRAY